jgi:hypothetical protein
MLENGKSDSTEPTPLETFTDLDTRNVETPDTRSYGFDISLGQTNIEFPIWKIKPTLTTAYQWTFEAPNESGHYSR